MYLWKKFIPDGFFHSVIGGGIFPSHESVCVLNTSKKQVHIKLTLYFEDVEKLDGFEVTVDGERTLHIRMDKLVNKDGIAVPKDKPYAILLASNRKIYVQYSRVDTSQNNYSMMTTMV